MTSSPYGVSTDNHKPIEITDVPKFEQSSTMFANLSRRHKIVIYSLGIFVCYFCFGILQEKITRGTYGDNGIKERFECTMALVFVQCFVNAIYARVIMFSEGKVHRDTTKTLYYALAAFTYLSAMVCSNLALKHVNYPTQVVGKSCKPIPVMILGVLFSRKRYALQKYLFVLMIVIGVAIFIYKDGKKISKTETTVGIGELLLIVSLTMDGLTGAVQDRMRSEHQTKSGPMMFNMNLWSVVFLGSEILISGEGIEFISFIKRHPHIITHLLVLSVASALGQFFIFLTVTEFGPLTCSIVTTTRKFFTVLGSVLLFGNNLSTRQWLGTTLVFTGLGLDSVYGNKKLSIKAVKSTPTRKTSEKNSG